VPMDRILIVEDEQVIRHVLTSFLGDMNVEAVAAASAEEAIALLDHGAFGVALVDIVLPGMDGLHFLGEMKRRSPDTEVIIMTSNASIETATRAIRSGAYDYIHKPFEDLEEVWDTVKRGLEKRALVVKNRSLLKDLARRNEQLACSVQRRDAQVEAGRAMGGIYELPQLLDFFVGLVSSELGVDRASIMLVEEGSHELFIAASRGLPAEVVSGTRIRIGEGIAGRVAETGLPIFVADTEREPQVPTPGCQLSSSFISVPITLSIPIKAQQQVLGVINITDRKSGRAFEDVDRAYIEGLAGQAAVAIERAKHMSSLRQARDQLEIRVQERTHELELAKNTAEKAVRFQSVFFANMSHELRTPMQAILSFAGVGILKTESADRSKLKNYFSRIEASGKQITHLVDNLLDLARLEAGKMPLELVHGNVVDIIARAVGEFQDVASQSIQLSHSGGLIGDVDEQLISRVVRNLISNAVKFTPEDGLIEIEISGNDTEVFVTVTDSGPGLAEGEQELIFERFVQSRSNPLDAAGTGLGLAICKEIISAHGGRIWAENAAQGGAAFHFWLPTHVVQGNQGQRAA